MIKHATPKQKKMVKLIVENCRTEGKTDSFRQLALRAGYSERAANDPKQITKSPTFQEMMREAGITGEKISSRFNELLDAPLKEKEITADVRLRTLEACSKLLYSSGMHNPVKIQFIDKFFNATLLNKTDA